MTSTPPGGEPRFSRDELIAALGAEPERAQRLWNAFGFARRHTDEKIFTQRDVDALALLVESSKAIPEDEQVATARAVGQTMARLADWEADMLAELSRNPAITWSTEEMAVALGGVQQLVWRRHLDIALARESIDDEAAESQRLAGVRTTEAVGFADIVGYTSLSRRIDMPGLETLLEKFEDRVHEVITAHGGQVVKTLGDAVLFTNTDAQAAAETAIEIQERVANVDPVPQLRVGMALGEILNRHGDVFGEPVNIASRLCGSARPGTILVDAGFAAQADGDRYRLSSIRPLSVRGYRRLRAWTLGRPRTH
ncbi:adenylate/guanylate cyclase domain-containing protein [Gordonia sp. X0973]|uniref:adenylate/guanylate cyclase domain-containing protein n=1 Tax=Gordonia sp. X0973 TaxID=2742602 RepID=UPI000F544845|nr:adenylate/guanylate cyclase domain-containing protein [Gordonia sp. X0973]QKT08767.1 adenylate/guanylate cyclase domain-containing protein [Gordonia sp. X0973]